MALLLGVRETRCNITICCITVDNILKTARPFMNKRNNAVYTHKHESYITLLLPQEFEAQRKIYQYTAISKKFEGANSEWRSVIGDFVRPKGTVGNMSFFIFISCYRLV